MPTERRNRRLDPGEWTARRRRAARLSAPDPGLGPLTGWATEVVVPGALLLVAALGVSLLFLL